MEKRNDEMIARYISGDCPLCGAENSTEICEYFHECEDLTIIMYCHECEKESRAVYHLKNVFRVG